MHDDLMELDRRIQAMLAHKQNRSAPYPIPERISARAARALRELEEKHDHGFSVELYLQNERRMRHTALFYRGRSVSYGEMFANALAFARSFRAMGIGQGDEAPVLIANLPEYVYTFLGLNLIGARMNTVGAWFHPDYLHEIFAATKCRYLFVSDDCFGAAKRPAERTDGIEQIVMFSLLDSLPTDSGGHPYNPYQALDDRYNDFRGKVAYWKENTDKEILTKADFLALGAAYTGDVVADTTLDDVAAITYTSGTTKPGYPKGCVHSNRNYMAISRFKKPDVSGMPAMKNITALALLPSYTQTVLTTTYCDPLYLGCTVALEPFYSEAFFLHAMEINRSNYVVNTPGFFIQLAKKLNGDPDWSRAALPYLLLPTIAGEPASLGEERYLNKTARRHRFGAEKTPLGLLSVPFSIGGGSTENGGVLITLFRAWQSMRPGLWLRHARMELGVLPLAETEVLDESGRPCAPGVPGRLVVNSPCNQIRYVNDAFNADMHITDANGKRWYSGGAYAVKCARGSIRIVGRPDTDIVTPNGAATPRYVIEDAVNSDDRNIMSAVVVKVETADGPRYVCHIEKQPDTRMADEQILGRCKKRLAGSVNAEILALMYLKLRDGFPLAPSGKRDIAALVAEGIDDTCFPCVL